MKNLLLAILISASFISHAEEYENVIQCSAYPKLIKTDYDFKNSEIKYPEKIRKIIPELMRLDLVQKIDALSLVLPKDWHESEGKPYEVRLQAYNDSIFIQQANCLVHYFKRGDQLFYFAQAEKGSYDKGYALFRGKQLIAIVVTEGVRV